MSAATNTNLSAQVADEMQGPSLVIMLCASAMTIFMIWAAMASVDEIVRGQGTMISSSRPQIIQNLEGGILAELKVKEGDVVEAGTILARLHSTQFQSSVDETRDQITALAVRQLRLEAELAGQFDFNVPENLVQRSPELVASERTLLQARQDDFVTRRDGAMQVLMQAEKEKNLLENLLDRKIVALIEVTRARKSFADAKTHFDEIMTQTELERAQEYSDALKEMQMLQQSLKSSRDQLNRTILTSPMRGIVNNLSITTIGGVVRPGEEIAQVIPLDEELFVEAHVQPKDIAGVRPGQEATVKLSAYDYTIFGSLKGRVKFISADTFKDERAGADAQPHYKVTLAVDVDALTERQRSITLRPGMLAEVELHTGEKTILSYLMKPLYKSREALREP
ncbi:MAG: HlyD family efflux transporter periplasmic adaptor subunit [Aliishimia sp.]